MALNANQQKKGVVASKRICILCTDPSCPNPFILTVHLISWGEAGVKLTNKKALVECQQLGFVQEIYNFLTGPISVTVQFNKFTCQINPGRHFYHSSQCFLIAVEPIIENGFICVTVIFGFIYIYITQKIPCLVLFILHSSVKNNSN